MFIYIARHAWAEERDESRWPDDSLRPLTDEGSERYMKVVKTLAGRGFDPGRIATSPYTRCRQTADIIAKHVQGKPKIDALDALEPGSELEPLLEWSRSREGASVCWVGHSPDVEYLAAELIGASHIRFAKGAVAAIDIGPDVAAGDGQLNWLATAKILGL
jgi:phosphohistidine phosphatase